jgi:multisubunit Na+/H+ antiporter MnhF subunit
MIALAAAFGVCVLMAPTLLRLVAGPTLHDRALAANALVLQAALVCAAIAVIAGRTDWTDAAFALVFASFVTHAAILKFFRAGTFQAPMTRGEEAR